MASVSIRNVYKAFGSVEIIHGVSVEIEDHEFVVLVGPSGCGKSTLLRMIAGLEKITGGDIAIGDRVVNMVPPKERDIAMVFQNYALYPHMTVYKNMAFSMTLAKADAGEIDRRVREAAGILGLSDYLERFPRQLSGGQRQRVAMGRAIVRNPQVFLFDEPLSNLDAKLRVQMRTEIKLLHQRLHSTSIYVTHDQVEAMTMADKIVVMRDGYVEQAGTPLELYDHPVNRFVGGFIGSPAMNFLPGRIARNGTGAAVIADDGTRLPLSPDHPGEDGRPVDYGVRPSDLVLDLETTDAMADPAGASAALAKVPVAVADGGIDAVVDVVEPTGADTYVFGKIAGLEVCAMFNERHPLQPGQPIRLKPKVERVHLFDRQTGAHL